MSGHLLSAGFDSSQEAIPTWTMPSIKVISPDNNDLNNGNHSMKSTSHGNLSQSLNDHVVTVEDTKPLTEKEKLSASNGEHVRSFQRRSSMENFGLATLLTPALTILPGIQGNDAWSKKFHELRDEHKDLVLAAAHIDDALHGRGAYGKARAIFKSKIPQGCFSVIDNRWFRYLMELFIVLFSILPLWETPQENVLPGKVEIWVIVLEVVCISMLIVDLALHLIFYTWDRFWSLAETKWLRVEFVLTCMFCVDFIILCIQEVAVKQRLVMPFRCLRGATFMCKAKNVAHIFDVCLSIMFKLGKVFIVIILFIMLFGGIGIHLFVSDYHYIGCLNTTINCTENYNNVYTGSFDHIGLAFLRLFVLLTTENFPEFMMPAFNNQRLKFFYFGTFLYIGVFFLTAILLAIIVDNYWAFSKRNVKIERKRERAEIIKAWNILDPLGQGCLSVNDEKIRSLFKKLRPQNSDDEISELIDYIDEDGDAVIDTFEWTTRLTDALNYEFEKEPLSFKKSAASKCITQYSESVRRVLQSVAFTRVILVLIFVHSILFFVKWYEMSNTAVYIIQGIKTAIIAGFLIECILRVIGQGRYLFLQALEIADFILTIIAIVTNVLWYLPLMAVNILDNVDDRKLFQGWMTVVSCLCIVMRLGFNSKQTKMMVLTFVRVSEVMLDLTWLILIIANFYAILGLESFYGRTKNDAYQANHYEYGCGLGFQSFLCSLLVVFQMTSTSNWHEIMNATFLSVSGWTWIYFVSCYLVINLVFINLFVAIAIEAFNKLTANNEELNNTLQDTLTYDENQDKNFAESAKKFFSNVIASSRDRRIRESERRPSLAVINERRRSLSLTPVSRSRVSLLQSVASASQLNHDRCTDMATVPEVQQESHSESGEEDYSGLTTQQKREKMMKKRRQKRKRTISKIKVMMAFRKKSPDQIDLHVGDEVNVLEKKGDWIRGESRGRTGWFPSEYVMETVKKSKNHTSTVSPEPPEDKEVESNDNQQEQNPFIQTTERSPSSTNLMLLDDVAHSLIKKSRMKKQGGDWRRQIHGDMTVMNHDEMLELNKLVKAGIKNKPRNYSRTQSRSNIVSIRDNPISENPELNDEKLEVSKVAVPQISILPALSLPELKEDDEDEDTKDTKPAGLTVEKPKVPKHLKKDTKKKGEMPEWAKKFAQSHSLKVDKDLKVDTDIPGEDDDLNRETSAGSTRSNASGKSKKSQASTHSTLSVKSVATESSLKTADFSDKTVQGDIKHKDIMAASTVTADDTLTQNIDAIIQDMEDAEKADSRPTSAKSGRSARSDSRESGPMNATKGSIEDKQSSKKSRKSKGDRAALIAKLRR